MDLFDNLGEKLQDVTKKSGIFAQKAAKKSGDLLEITKLSLKIKDNESKIKLHYEETGKLLFEKYNGVKDMPEEYKDFIEYIIDINKDIIVLKEKISEIKEHSDKTYYEDEDIIYPANDVVESEYQKCEAKEEPTCSCNSESCKNKSNETE